MHRSDRERSQGSTEKRGEHLEDVKKKAAEEFFAILFLYMADWHRYGKIIEDMENVVLCKKRPICFTQ